MKNLKLRIAAFILFTVVQILICNYYALPVLSFGYTAWQCALLLWSIVGTALFINYEEFSYSIGDGMTKVSKVFAGLTITNIAILFLILPLFTTWGFFHADQYKQQIGEVVTSDFSTDVTLLDPTNVRVVDDSMAQQIGHGTITTFKEDPSLGSRVEVGDYIEQKVINNYYHVAPLLHDGFFNTWDNNNKGTPGFIMVSSTDKNDMKLVTKNLKGEDIAIIYQPNAWWGKDLERHIYNAGYRAYRLDYTFEVDDTLNPWWVVRLVQCQIGYSGEDVVGTLLVNAKTGVITPYKIHEIPKFVDRGYPEDIINDQIDNWGEFIEGWKMSDAGKRQSTMDKLYLRYGNDGQCYYVTDLTSMNGGDEGSMGMLMVNSHTKKVHWYQISGYTEKKIMQSAAGALQDFGYKPSFPNLYNVEGEPTHVMSLTDNAMSIKEYAFVSYKNFNTVGHGPDIQSALRSYRQALVNGGNKVSMSEENSNYSIVAVIQKIGMDVRQGNSVFTMILQGDTQKLYQASSALSDELSITNVGDVVNIGFSQYEEPTITISYFDNIKYVQSKTSNQKKVEHYFNSVDSTHKANQVIVNADEAFRKLSPQEKLNLYKKMKE